MAFHVYGPSDFVPDPGTGDRDYPIENKYQWDKLPEIVYDHTIQNTSYNQANIAAFFNEWYTSYFSAHHFKSVTIRTQAPFNEFKSFMRRIYKVEKPILVIDPRPPEIVEDFVFAQNMLRYNSMNPTMDRIGGIVTYSYPVMTSDLFQLVYRPNRMRFTFNTMIVESGINNRDKIFDHIVMRMPHKVKFTIRQTMPLLIPTHYIANIANFHGMDWKSDEFLEFLNGIASYGIKREIRNNGTYMFFMLKDVHMYFSSSDFPAKDSEENAEAIEWGARVVDSYTIEADLPMDFVFMTRKEFAVKYDKGRAADPDDITYISPIVADLDWPTEVGDYKLTNRVDLQLQAGDDPTVNILPLIADYDRSVWAEVQNWVNHGEPIADVVMARVYPNGSYREIGSTLSQDGTLTILGAATNKLYTCNIYVNLKTINFVREGREIRHIGTIETGKFTEG